MDPAYDMSDQIPDENYIERLFPKCQPAKSEPKRGAARSKNSSGQLFEHNSANSSGGYGANNSNSNNNNNNNNNNNKNNINNGPGRQQQQQPRTKVVQKHSRRELSSRKGSKQEPAPQSTAGARLQDHSSDSSDVGAGGGDVGGGGAGGCEGNLRKSSKSSSRRGLIGGAGRSQSMADNRSSSSSIQTPATDRASVVPQSAPPPRKPSKYVASQNLQQHLQRSQSAYHSGCLSSHAKPKPNDVSQHKQSDASSLARQTDGPRAKAESSGRGIVKSSSASSSQQLSEHPSQAQVTTTHSGIKFGDRRLTDSLLAGSYQARKNELIGPIDNDDKSDPSVGAPPAVSAAGKTANRDETSYLNESVLEQRDRGNKSSSNLIAGETNKALAYGSGLTPTDMCNDNEGSNNFANKHRGSVNDTNRSDGAGFVNETPNTNQRLRGRAAHPQDKTPGFTSGDVTPAVRNDEAPSTSRHAPLVASVSPQMNHAKFSAETQANSAHETRSSADTFLDRSGLESDAVDVSHHDLEPFLNARSEGEARRSIDKFPNPSCSSEPFALKPGERRSSNGHPVTNEDDNHINLFVYDNATDNLLRTQVIPSTSKCHENIIENTVDDGAKQSIDQVNNIVTRIRARNRAIDPNQAARDEILAITGGKPSSDLNSGRSLVTVQNHQASDKLLAGDLNEDASTEELCTDATAVDLVPPDVAKMTSSSSKVVHPDSRPLTHKLESHPKDQHQQQQQQEHDEVRGPTAVKPIDRSEHQPPHIQPATQQRPLHQQARENKTHGLLTSSVSLRTLQTVDEKAEIGLEETPPTSEQARVPNGDSHHDMLLTEPIRSSPESSVTKRPCIAPPGRPQRITPGPEVECQDQSSLNDDRPIVALRPESKPQDLKSPIIQQIIDLGDDGTSSSSNNSRRHGSGPSEGPHTNHHPNRHSNEHPPQMPIISESQLENEQETPTSPREIPPTSGQPICRTSQLSSESFSTIEFMESLNKVPVSHSNSDTQNHQLVDLSTSPQEQTIDTINFSLQNTLSRQTSQERQHNGQVCVPEANETPPPQQQDKIDPECRGASSYTPDMKAASKPVTNVRHHKLPNETSHYSIVRTGVSMINTASPMNNSNSNMVAPRSSSMQFNVLSDGESELEDVGSSLRRQMPTIANSRSSNFVSMLSSSSTSKSSKSDQAATSQTSTTAVVPSSSSSRPVADVDLSPSGKTAFAFPRLDEGLSSDAESADDEAAEDDDERAMEADVDADDDDDEEEEEEDDDDEDDDDDDTGDFGHNDAINFDRNNNQSSMVAESSSSGMGWRGKPSRAPVNSSAQSSASLNSNAYTGSTNNDQVEMHPSIKSSQNQNYVGGYMGAIGPEVIENNDLKGSMDNYSNVNGGNNHSNYWMGQQPNSLASQASTNQRSSAINNGVNSMSSTNSVAACTNVAAKSNSVGGSSAYNRGEAKSSNRLSSDTDNETDRLLGSQRNDQLKLTGNDVGPMSEIQSVNNSVKQNSSSREVLIEGVLFDVKYLGSTQFECEGRSEKSDRLNQAEMAVHEVKYRNGEYQAVSDVQLFISAEKIMVLDGRHRKIMMEHSLRTISYTADIGDAIVLLVKKRGDAGNISCHVFESSDAHKITKSISNAFQVAYNELLRANGVGDVVNYLPKELDYQEVLNSQEMSTEELEMFARKENQREVIVPKKPGEILGLSIVESGWGSVLPTVVIANLKPDGPAHRCKNLSIGDQILSVNGISLVGLPLADCQQILRKTKRQRVARLSIVPCPITVEVKIKRPDTKYQLGFSVQNGVICSLLRGGIAERGGVRVGHRIMSINGTTVVGVPHEKIVTLLASSVGEIRMKTCLTSLYRQILGEEKAVHY